MTYGELGVGGKYGLGACNKASERVVQEFSAPSITLLLVCQEAHLIGT